MAQMMASSTRARTEKESSNSVMLGARMKKCDVLRFADSKLEVSSMVLMAEYFCDPKELREILVVDPKSPNEPRTMRPAQMPKMGCGKAWIAARNESDMALLIIAVLSPPGSTKALQQRRWSTVRTSWMGR